MLYKGNWVGNLCVMILISLRKKLIWLFNYLFDRLLGSFLEREGIEREGGGDG